MNKTSRIAAFVTALGAFVASLFVIVPPASAGSFGNVYLVVNNSRCAGGGKVTQITGSVDNVWTGGDSGDNIIYPRVDLTRTNTFNGRALCGRSSLLGGPYWINVVGWSFRPTRTGQTFWY